MPPAETITDFAVIPASGVLPPSLRAELPVADPVHLTADLVLGRIDDAERYMDACESAGENFAPRRQFGHRYAFVRSNAPDGSYGWDPDNLIQHAIMLSRYIRPNAHCTEYAGRRIDQQGAETTIAPLELDRRFYAFDFRSQEGRTWLDAEDADALARLLRAFLSADRPLPERLSNATWTTEWASRERFVHQRSIMIVTALESLLKTGRSGVTGQFTTRVPALAEDLRIAGVDRALAARIYDQRSASVHGSTLTAQAHPDDLISLERTLRATLRRAIEDPGFRAHFVDDDAVQSKWPWNPPVRRRKSRVDLSALDDDRLLAHYRQVLAELRQRGVVRSANNPIADIAENLVASYYDGDVAPASTRDYDVLASDGRKIQVKALRRTQAGRTALSALRSHDFDLLVVVVFTAGFEVEEAFEMDVEVVGEYQRWSRRWKGHRLSLTRRLCSDPRVRRIAGAEITGPPLAHTG